MKVELKDVSFKYPNTEKGAIKGINLSIKQGEFVLLAGASGCGKTTITRLINGLIPGFYGGKQEGKAFINEKEIKDYKSFELSSMVGCVFQNPRTQFFNVDTDSELAFGLENAGKDRETINNVLDKVTDDLGIWNLRNRDIFKLSGGEKQKIAFASVYATDPDIYVLDEPSANLDAKGVESIKHNLEKIKDKGKTVIVAEHRLYYLKDLVDRVIIMCDGHIDKDISGEVFRKMQPKELNQLGLRTNRAEKVENRREKVDSKEESINLTLKNICVELGGKTILDDLNLNFPAGTITCITGHNGVGKSTLLRTLCGLIKAKRGEIIVKGKKCGAKKLKEKAFLVMQDVNYQLFADSVYNECSLGLKEGKGEKTDRALESMGLCEYKDRHPNTLSGGEKQRLAIAVSLMMDKDILLFDEPTSGLDYKNMILCADIMKKMAAMGKTVIVVTHDEEFMKCCCERVISFS
ncbi:MAG: energy-coupling factor ABC transporter ATP-binding protein [Lachnospiraceae bacterium]|nr:energy-coupling factor ABC transporter ATP-binding protein [Lachnospiraceae bacterium]